jgi:phage virion morphogenesis protein
MVAPISIAVDGEDELLRALTRALERTDKPRDLMATLADVTEAQTRERFETEKSDPITGESWAPWSDKYGARSSDKNPNHKLLDDEGHLLSSLNSFYGISGDNVEIGVISEYAATHQFGDDKRGIPQRRFVGLSPENDQDITEILNDWARDVFL